MIVAVATPRNHSRAAEHARRVLTPRAQQVTAEQRTRLAAAQTAYLRELRQLPRPARVKVEALLAGARAWNCPEVEAVITQVQRSLAKLRARFRQAVNEGRAPSTALGEITTIEGNLAQLALECGVVAHDPAVRGLRRGRPSAAEWALLAAAVAAECRQHNRQHVWPAVSALLAPVLHRAGKPVSTDAQHLRQLVNLAKRKHGSATWARKVRALRQSARSPRPR